MWGLKYIDRNHMTEKTTTPQAQNPFILRALRLIEAFAKSNDERDFFLDRVEGFIIFLDLDKPHENIESLERELQENKHRYCPIPKMSFYETKKIMEGFVNEKVYDIDTKEKLLDIIDSKDARENFLEFIYDQHMELEKWQQYYQERSRIRIIEWLRSQGFNFVFEEDLEMNVKLIEKLKELQYETKVSKEILNARKILQNKSKTYYSSEALNPRPKRGRPPKLQAKQETDQESSADIYILVPPPVRQFLFVPDISSVSAATFSEKYESEEALIRKRHVDRGDDIDDEMGDLNKKLASLRNLSSKWVSSDEKPASKAAAIPELKKTPVAKETPSKSVEKKNMKIKEPAIIKSPKTDTDKKAKPVRSIIKKSVETEVAPKKTTPKKRIINEEKAEENKKRPLRKIIPTNSNS